MRTIDLTGAVVGAALKIHRKLGPGLLESAYEACLAHELQQLGLPVERQKAVPLVYGGVKLNCGFRADLVVAGRVAVELQMQRCSPPRRRSPATIPSPLAEHSGWIADQLPRRSPERRHSPIGEQLPGRRFPRRKASKRKVRREPALRAQRRAARPAGWFFGIKIFSAPSAAFLSALCS